MLKNLEKDFPPHTPRPAGAALALEGVRVIDFTHFVAGPLATMILADMGADIIKIEAPERGDDFRHYPPVAPGITGLGAPYVWCNRNKRSLALDLKSPEGLEIAKALIADADVVCENFSSGVIERFGLDYETVKKINPRIIYCSVSAFGRDGESKDRVGFDPITQSESGFIDMNGYADRPGVRALSPVMDISTAMMASNGILGALLARHRTGEGQRVDVALFDNAVLMTGYASMQHLYSGENPQRNGNVSPDTCPSAVFQSQDGQNFYINCGNDKMFQRLALLVLERPDLAEHPVYSIRNGRMEQQTEILDLLAEIFAQRPWAYWQQKMRAANMPCGEVRTIEQALRSPEARERKLVTRIEHPELGWLPNLRLPIVYDGTPMADPQPAPTVGQHSREILTTLLNFDEERIAELEKSGVLTV